MVNGTIKFFSETKGFGFIIGEDGNEYFVHTTGVKDDLVLRENDEVSFEIVDGDRGLKADKVKLTV